MPGGSSRGELQQLASVGGRACEAAGGDTMRPKHTAQTQAHQRRDDAAYCPRSSPCIPGSLVPWLC